MTFTCAASARVATAARRTACLHVSRAMQAARRRSDFDFRGGSAAGPKPGRVRCYLELGGGTYDGAACRNQLATSSYALRSKCQYFSRATVCASFEKDEVVTTTALFACSKSFTP